MRFSNLTDNHDLFGKGILCNIPLEEFIKML